ncbi:MAG: LamG protein, partial [Flavipsychrobacter sp.]|nr:LamG protein [Flavipsychrobacter sp.]
MRFITLSLCTFFYSILSIAQAPIAHWDMNGTANDVTGRGHTGHMTNVTPVAGMSGLPNTAYAFNGTNSMITSGYLPDLNASKFTICATIMVKGFYSGLCQDNVVIVRGNTSSSAISFVLDFSDNYFDPSGSACTNFDPTSDVFSMIYGGNAAPSGTALQYHPTMQKDKWYRVVSTFDGITFRIFINDTLKNTYTSAGAP